MHDIQGVDHLLFDLRRIVAQVARPKANSSWTVGAKAWLGLWKA
jgi:hypothetical protein